MHKKKRLQCDDNHDDKDDDKDDDTTRSSSSDEVNGSPPQLALSSDVKTIPPQLAVPPGTGLSTATATAAGDEPAGVGLLSASKASPREVRYRSTGANH